MPRGGPCNHRECISWGEGCRMLTDAELTPSEQDLLLAEQLAQEGWVQTSARYRHVARWKTPPPTIEEILRPEHLNTRWGKKLAEKLAYETGESGIRSAASFDRDLVEQRELTVRQFIAFKNRTRPEYLKQFNAIMRKRGLR